MLNIVLFSNVVEAFLSELSQKRRSVLRCLGYFENYIKEKLYKNTAYTYRMR